MGRKKRPEGKRAPNGASSIYYSEYDQKWHGRVTVGVKDDGSPDRRHVKRSTEAEVIDEVRKLESEREQGTVRKPGRAWTVEKWLTHWVENIAAPTVRYNALKGYRAVVYTHLIPGVGKHRIDKIEPEHFERLYAKIIASGKKPATAHQVHRAARTAFGEAYRRGHIKRNPVQLAKPPRLEEAEVDPFEPEEIQRLIKTALARRNGVRFVLALAIGTRQGETIGFKWSRLNTETKTLRVAKQLQRQSWKHGCNDPHSCGETRHKREPCKVGCKLHKKCPPPCPADCTKHAAACPKRHGGGLVEEEVKSRAGRRGIVLPDQLFALLVQHRAEQAREREVAGSVWQEGDWMFAQPTGKPIDPRKDLREWRGLLDEAAVRPARLHDARHTAATVLLLLGVPERAVMEFMGWSNGAMTKRYQHVTAVLRRDIAGRLDGYLWEGNETQTETPNGEA